jgi:hypothetical protein
MTEINLLFELTDKTDINSKAKLLQDNLSRLEISAEAFPEDPARMTGMEVVAAIGVTVTIVHGSRDLISEIRKVIQAIKELVKEYRELKQVLLDVGPERVPLDELTEEHYEELAEYLEDIANTNLEGDSNYSE